MAWLDSGDLYGEVSMDLVDGYLSDKALLIRLAGQWPIFAFEGTLDWEKWCEGSIFQELGDAVRRSYCARKDLPRPRSSQYCEAWLLEPVEDIGSRFELKTQKLEMQNRRLLVTLQYDCKVGKECLRYLLNQTHFEVIPDDQYKNYDAFQKAANDVFEIISTPFLAPCVIAKQEIEKCGYRCFELGR